MKKGHLITSLRNSENAIRFVILLIMFYLIFSQSNLLMNSVLSTGGKYYNSFLAEHFNYIQALRSMLISSSVLIIKLFGFYAIHNQADILIIKGPYMRINYSCLGLGVLSFLSAFLIAFPAKWQSKIKMLIVGIFAIFSLNVLRIAGLGLFLTKYQSQRKYFIYHHEIYNILVYACIFFMLYFWMRKQNLTS